MLEGFVREGLGLVGRGWAVVVGKVGFGVGGLALVSGGPCSWVWGWWVGVGRSEFVLAGMEWVGWGRTVVVCALRLVGWGWSGWSWSVVVCAVRFGANVAALRFGANVARFGLALT